MKRFTCSQGNWARVAAGLLLAVFATSAATAGASGGANQIREIKVHQEGGQTIVTVIGSAKPTFTAFKLSSPQRLVVDVANSRVKGVPSVTTAGTPLVDAVAVSEFSSGGVSVSRVMIGFKAEAAYRVSAVGNNLVVALRGGPAPKDAPAIAGADPEELAAARAETVASEKRRGQAEAEASAAKQQLAGMQADVEAARKELEAAKAELSSIAARGATDARRAQEAAREAQSARTDLVAAKAELARLKVVDGKTLAGSDKKASQQTEVLRQEIARAEAKAAEERAKRESLERHIASLEQQRNTARVAAQSAEQALAAAAAAERSAKEDVSRQVAAMTAAKDRAASAIAAQKEAQLAYERATATEREGLLGKLKDRERDAVEANQRVAQAEGAKRQAERAAGAAIESSRQAQAESARALAEQKRNEQRLVAELSGANAARSEAEKQAGIAELRAASAVSQREAAEEALRLARASAATDSATAKRTAAQAVAAAEERIRRADAARIDADKQRVDTQKRLAAAEQNLMRTKTGAAAAETALGDAQATIAVQEKKIAALEDAKKSLETASALDAAKARDTIASQEKQIAELSATKTAPAAPGADKARMTQEEKRLARLEKMRKGAAQAPKQSRMDDDGVPPEITDIRFVDEDGAQKIVIESSAAVLYDQGSQGARKATLVLRNAALPAILERTLDAGEFNGVVRTVSSYEENGSVRVEVELADAVSGTVSQRGDAIEWAFAKARKSLDITPHQPAGSATKVVNREEGATYAYPQERTAAYGVTLPTMSDKKKKYSGRHIDLDFKDADIHNILRLLADVGQVNIVTADDVTGTVTIRMRDVPWDQALDVVLQAKHYGMIREGNLIRVAPLATLEKEREMEIARRKQSKELEPLETRLIPISYAQAAEIQPRAADILSERGKMSVDARTNVIIARDTAANLDQIEMLVRNLDTQTPQVLIEGRIVEATSTYAREIGIQWGGDFTASSATGNPTGLGFPSTVGVAGGATDGETPTAGLSTASGGQPNPNFAVNLPAAAGTGSGGALGITLGSIANNANLNLRLSAMEEEGTLRILSSPKILTLDNREAFIEQGTLIPYSRVSAQGVQTAFKEAKLNLTVTPHVTADGSVLIKVAMTRDEPDFNNKGARGDPTILKREARTELLVNDGHTAVIGGIFTRNNGTSFKKVPFFGDIPILGWLFKSKSDSDRRTEMLIFITPRIVNRAESIGN
jgi:type IV pilus assembly protein PilQ